MRPFFTRLRPARIRIRPSDSSRMRCRRLMSLASWRLSIRPCVCVRAANSRTLPASGDRHKCIRQHPCDTPAWGRSTRVCCRYPLPSRLCSHRQVRERDQPFWYGTQGPVIRQGGHLIKPQGPPRDNIGWIGRGRFHPQSRAGWVLNSRSTLTSSSYRRVYLLTQRRAVSYLLRSSS